MAGWGLCLEVRQLDVKSADPERIGWKSTRETVRASGRRLLDRKVRM